MQKRHDRTLSLPRQQLLALAAEYQQLVAALPGRDILVRGTLNWHTPPSGRYPGITRVVNSGAAAHAVGGGRRG